MCACVHVCLCVCVGGCAGACFYESLEICLGVISTKTLCWTKAWFVCTSTALISCLLPCVAFVAHNAPLCWVLLSCSWWYFLQKMTTMTTICCINNFFCHIKLASGECMPGENQLDVTCGWSQIFGSQYVSLGRFPIRVRNYHHGNTIQMYVYEYQHNFE